MTGPRVLTIVLNWRTPEMTLKAARAAQRAMVDIAGEIVIIDNDSGDGSFEKMQSETRDWNRVRVIQSGHNGGFGAGNNAGIRAGFSDGTRPDYTYILNSDAFPAEDAIAKLLAHLEATPSAGLAGSHIHGPEGKSHVTCFRFPSILGEFEGAARIGTFSHLLRRHIVPLPVPETTQPVDWLAGASLMIRQDALDEIGGFDETFFLYFEETDLCLRAARAGWQTHYVAGSHVEHIGSVSTGMKSWGRVPDYWFASRRYYFIKNHGRGYLALVTLAHLTGAGLGSLWRLIRRKGAPRPPHFLRDLVLGDLGLTLRGTNERKADA
ncbi:N-acetylglucosaminyl-diphospho-decaprenol L-rhamnosyltransferase [Roseovarius sp. A-2]|uniref:glycosyltransferase n=1 Tax=Roseovarius sp. A-2 TaxID=1570360 RepID=UPI0009B57B36|nr:glycosyltransferase family 2 protein [Roseovarius sp. A-2]GAW36133.1 N-acetylglucosaminyl-diphospho-decaprenol L-rhamnosyltransferase [Roseovarius sp. A-2]